MKKLFTFFITLSFLLAACGGTQTKEVQTEKQVTLIPVDSISHAHALAVDRSSKLYIATHYGLLVLIDDKNLYQVGEKKDDYMGFQVHPTISNAFYASGHPSSGGNLGVQKSEDGGINWKKISDGAKGPVDFHAMAISPADPTLFYGWYKGQLQRSTDGGITWEHLETSLTDVIALKADLTDSSKVFAATGQGLLVSDDQGKTWASASTALAGAIVTALASHPTDSSILLSFSERLGLAKSLDGGVTWTAPEQDFGGDVLLHIAFNPSTPDSVYAITKNNVLYKSTDGGSTWAELEL